MSLICRPATARLSILQVFLVITPRLHGVGIKQWWPLSVRPSVCLSVACLTLSRERKVYIKLKIGRREAVTPFRHRKVKGQGHHGRLTLWHKISHIVATGRPTNFKFGMQLKYGDPRHRHSRWPQRSKVTVTTWRRQFYACLPITLRRFRDQLPADCWLFVSNLRYSHVCVMKCCYVFVSVFFLSVSYISFCRPMYLYLVRSDLYSTKANSALLPFLNDF